MRVRNLFLAIANVYRGQILCDLRLSRCATINHLNFFWVDLELSRLCRVLFYSFFKGRARTSSIQLAKMAIGLNSQPSSLDSL